jgi:multidrug efflux system outer membrane protein
MIPLCPSSRFLFALSFLALGGCEVGPDYVPPPLDLPPAWHETAPGQSAPASATEKTAWWKDFNDPALTALIEQALANNENLAIASARIIEVRGLRESAFGSLFPQIGVGADASRGDPGVSTTNSILSFYQGAFDASWEADLFGGNRRKVEAEDAATGAAEAAYRDASLSLAAEVAREYILLRQFQAQIGVTRRTADIQRRLYEITQDRYKGGLVSTLDVAQAQTLYKTTAARIPDFERQITASSYRLSILLGENPGGIEGLAAHSSPIPSARMLPVLDAPADIMRQRPDVAEAERELAEATALQGVAISALYPKVSLSALFGVQYGSLPVFHYAATHHVWNLGADITMPVLNFGSIEGQINAADARQVQALHHYKQTVIQALADVETDLSNLSKESNRDTLLEEAVTSSHHAVDIARDRYRHGLSDFTPVLQAEQQRFTAQLDQIESQAIVAQDIIALHKALGDNQGDGDNGG